MDSKILNIILDFDNKIISFRTKTKKQKVFPKKNHNLS